MARVERWSSKESDELAVSMARARIRRKSPTRIAIWRSEEGIGQREREGSLIFVGYLFYEVVVVKGGEGREKEKERREMNVRGEYYGWW